MAFLTSLDSGQYSPTLSVKAGVDYSVETLPFNSGKADINQLINERAHGNFDYVSRFKGGFFNFENYSPTTNTPSIFPTRLKVYSTDGQYSGVQKQYSGQVTGIYQHNSPSIINYWNSSTNTSTIAQSGLRRFAGIQNFSNAMPLMNTENFAGQNVSARSEGNVYLNVLGSAILADGPNYIPITPDFAYYGPKADLTVYGRFKINHDNTPIATFGTNFDFFPENGGSGVINDMGTGNYIQVAINKLNVWNRSVPAGVQLGARALGVDNVTRASGFYQFIYSFSQYGIPGRNSYAVLYEGDDVKPLRMTFSGQVQSQYGAGLAGFYSGVTLLSQQSGVLWSEFGVDNRLWSPREVNEFNRSRFYPSSFIDDVPSLSDNDYVNFHFPVNSVGTLGVTNSGDYADTKYSITLQPSGLSPYIYEFDRSEFNPNALRVRTVMQSVSNNPSGYLKARINLDGVNAYWQSYPIPVPSSKTEILISGNLYNNSDIQIDLADIKASGITSSNLNLGAWYLDNGSSWGGDINLYSAKVELDSWLITQPKTSNGAIPLDIRAGVVYCKQTISPDSGVSTGQSQSFGSRIHGNFDYSKFECGYFNFENTPLDIDQSQTTESPLYSYDYRFGGVLRMPPNNDHIFDKPFVTDFNRQRGHKNVKDAVIGTNSFSTVIMASGIYSSFTLLSPNSGDLMAGPDSINYPSPGFPVGSISIFGRFRVATATVNDYRIVQFGLAKNYIEMQKDKIRFYLSRTNSTPQLPVYDIINGSLSAVGSFYNFMLVQDVGISNQSFLYESHDDTPLQLTNIGVIGGYRGWFNDGTGTTFTASTETPIVWSDFGISNRAWNALQTSELNTIQNFPGFYISDNPYSSLPPPSGSDSTYINFHYPLNSSGNINLTTRRGTDELPINGIQYLIPLASGLSSSLFQFDSSNVNPNALKLDMWVNNISNNASGNINAKILFGGGDYWQSNDMQVMNNGPNLISFSGKFFDSVGNPSDMSDLTADDLYAQIPGGQTAGAILGIGTWYNNINIPYSADMNVYSARIYMDAYCIPPTTGNMVTLCVSGQQKSTNQLDLYLQNSTAYNNLDLYLEGKGLSNNSCDLYIAGGFTFKDTTLFIGGLDTSNNNVTLFTEGGLAKASMPLSIYSSPPSALSGNLPLFMWATASSGTANNVSLFIGENAPSGERAAGMNLYLNGPSSRPLTASMNLFIKRDLYSSDGSVSLFCQNEVTGLEGNLTLFMSAPSGTLGAIPASASMNLFIARDYEGIDGGLSMYTSGPVPTTSGVDLYMMGGPNSYGSLPLMTDGIGVLNSEQLKLYINGF